MLLRHSDEFGRVGELGIAFLYEYAPPQRTDYVIGADVFVYRGTLEELDENPNPMIHSWTIEDDRESHRNKDGTMCTVEAIILGKEAELLRKEYQTNDPNKFKKKFFVWPDIDDLLDKS